MTATTYRPTDADYAAAYDALRRHYRIDGRRSTMTRVLDGFARRDAAREVYGKDWRRHV